jgi:hypothetical protein
MWIPFGRVGVKPFGHNITLPDLDENNEPCCDRDFLDKYRLTRIEGIAEPIELLDGQADQLFKKFRWTRNNGDVEETADFLGQEPVVWNIGEGSNYNTEDNYLRRLEVRVDAARALYGIHINNQNGLGMDINPNF